MSAAKRPDRPSRGWPLRHPTRRDGAIALVLLLLPSAAALYLCLRHTDIAVIALWVAIALGLPVMWLAWTTFRETGRSDGSGGDLSLVDIADQLAVAVRTQWEAEAAVRRLNDPWPLPVSWTAADATLSDSWDALLTLATTGAGWPHPPPPGIWGSGPDDLAGSGGDIVRVLAKVPTGRLVVLGEPGAGKTMLMVRLVLDLLKDRVSGAPVPVLAPLASWDVDEQGLHEWLSSQLIVDHPGLRAAAPLGAGDTTWVEALFASGLICPVLDGLDEIPDALWSRAVNQIIDSLRPGECFVITCRTGRYQAILKQAKPGTALRTAAAIELLPLDGSTVSRYLLDDAEGSNAKARWESVLDEIRNSTLDQTMVGPRGAPIAQVLTIPLMISLARTIYNARPGEDVATIPLHPSELLNVKLFPNQGKIEDHLFGSFISAAYRWRPNSGISPQRHRWKPEQAQRWLSFLAETQERHHGGSTDIEWWKLPTVLPKRLPGSVLGVVVGLAFALGYPFRGIGIGLAAGIIVGLAARRWLRSRMEGLLVGVAGGATGGILGGFAAQLLRGHVSVNLAQNLVGGLATGIAMSLMIRFVPSFLAGFASELVVAFYQDHPIYSSIREAIGSGYHVINAIGGGLTAFLFVEIIRRSDPAYGIRWYPRLPVWFFTGVICSVATGIFVWTDVGVLAGLAVGLAGVAASGLVAGVAESVFVDPAGAASPTAVLRRDRSVFLASWLGLGVALGSVHGLAQSLTPGPTGRPQGIWYGAEIGLATFVVVGSVFGFIQSMWGPFVISRVYLGICGNLPWRYLEFLDDAHRNRGVLRQVGAAYQFRHVELQRRLVEELK